MKFSYSDLNIRFYWRYPNASPIELKLKNPSTKLKEVIYFKKIDAKGRESFHSVTIPDPKRKHTLCTIEVEKDGKVLKEVTVKATKQKYKSKKTKEEPNRIAEFIKEQGRSQSLRKAIDEVLSFSEVAIEVDNEKSFRTAFWDAYKDRFPKAVKKEEGVLVEG